MLLGIHIQNFGVLHDTTLGLSFAELLSQSVDRIQDLFDAARRGEPSDRLPLGQIDVLIGRNSSGKSACLTALSFLSDCLRHGVPYAADQEGRGGFIRLRTSGGCADIRFELLFSGDTADTFLSYETTLSCDSHGHPRVFSESAHRAVFNDGRFEPQLLLRLENGRGTILDGGTTHAAGVADTKLPGLAVYGALLAYPDLNRIYEQITRWFFGQFEIQHTPKPHTADIQVGQRHLSTTGDNIKNVLSSYQNEYPELFESIVDRISERMPDEKRIDQAFRNGGVTSGIRKLFTLLLLLEDPRPRPLICLEEPDGGLYHDMVDTLTFALRDYVIRNPDCQILFTTHSQYILEAVRPEEVWVFERRPEPDGSPVGGTFTRTRCAARDAVVRAMHDQGIGMGAIWYSGHLDSSWEDLHASGSSD